jgi:hypothetical protein
VLADRSRILRHGPDVPMVTLVADGHGRGPAGFKLALMRLLMRKSCAVLVVSDDEQDELPYTIAAEHCVARRQHVLVVECPRAVIGTWSSFASEYGVQRDNVALFVSELEVLDVEDIPPATPAGLAAH